MVAGVFIYRLKYLGNYPNRTAAVARNLVNFSKCVEGLAALVVAAITAAVVAITAAVVPLPTPRRRSHPGLTLMQKTWIHNNNNNSKTYAMDLAK